ncbi:MAG TPA: hypothetical protein VEH04_10605 [Verrucomicrobiae bacterium]|nr:hypothetical protein [Verrucomicrobiae bacterium]
MKERPILFSAAMVQAILAGRKSQTRRVVKPQPPAQFLGENAAAITNGYLWAFSDGRAAYPPDDKPGVPCPYGQPGDRLWVKETWRVHGGREYEYQQHQPSVIYRADADYDPLRVGESVSAEWRKSIFMPRWASRITLEITSVRVERLQEITPEDAIAEGVIVKPGEKPCPECNGRSPEICGFRDLWNSIHGFFHSW